MYSEKLKVFVRFSLLWKCLRSLAYGAANTFHNEPNREQEALTQVSFSSLLVTEKIKWLTSKIEVLTKTNSEYNLERAASVWSREWGSTGLLGSRRCNGGGVGVKGCLCYSGNANICYFGSWEWHYKLSCWQEANTTWSTTERLLTNLWTANFHCRSCISVGSGVSDYMKQLQNPCVNMSKDANVTLFLLKPTN